MAVSVGNSSFVTDGLVLYYNPTDTKNYTLTEVEVLVVAGGGGGGNYNSAGGGGGGGVVYSRSYAVTPGSGITVSVGSGGVASQGVGPATSPTNGGNSSFGSITAIGGGYGSPNVQNAVGNGGSGGGGGYTRQLGGTGTSGQGFNGGNGGGTSGAPNYPGGGGGGAGGPGGNAQSTNIAGNGGKGFPCSISGTLRYYGGGGGGSVQSGGVGGSGGIGGGGRGGSSAAGENGAANTGGGGGAGGYSGSTTFNGGSGGSGIVIVRYPGPQKATGGNTITFSDGYTIHTFTSGTSTFTPFSFPTNGTTITGQQDLSGNANSVTSTSVLYRTAENGYLEFDGTNSFMNGFLNLGTDATIEFVAKANWSQNNGGTPIPIAIDGDNYSSGPNIFFFNGTINWNQGDGGSNPFSGSSYPSSSSYVHIMVTNRWSTGISGGASLYINGSLVGTANALDCRTTGSNKLFIGRWHGGGYRVQMNFGILRIYNKALSASEVSQNFNAIRGRYGL